MPASQPASSTYTAFLEDVESNNNSAKKIRRQLRSFSLWRKIK
jgi:hypothetical protein